MNSDIFVDSSVLIEYYKGNQTDLLEALIGHAADSALSNSLIITDSPSGELNLDELKEEILPEPIKYRLCIGQIVVSEYLFQCLKIDSGGKAPLTLKRAGKVPEMIRQFRHSEFFHLFTWLEGGPFISEMAPLFMENYNLLPNDAIVLSICKCCGVGAIASFDATDFVQPCHDEGIFLIQNLADLEVYKATL